MQHHVSGKQHTLWLLAAMAAPIAHYSGCGWITALLTVLALLPLMLLPGSWEQLPKALAWLEVLWFGAAAGILLKNSAFYWPSSNDLAVPLVLLGLAAVTKSAAGPRIGAVTALCMALLAVPLALRSAEKAQPQWLEPAVSKWPAGLSLALLILKLPAAQKKNRGASAAAAGILAVVLAAMVQGSISLNVGEAVRDPFYQMARTIGHLEPIAAAAMTLGWYSMAVYMVQSAEACAEQMGLKKQRATVLAAWTAAAFVLIPQQPDAPFMLVLSTFFWVLIPFFNKNKKVKKVLDKRTIR